MVIAPKVTAIIVPIAATTQIGFKAPTPNTMLFISADAANAPRRPRINPETVPGTWVRMGRL